MFSYWTTSPTSFAPRLPPAVTVRRTHHGNLDAHVAQSSDAICPVSFDWGAPLELEAKFGEEVFY